MPAVLKSTEGSFSGTREADGIIVCPRFLKNSKNLERISSEVIASSYNKKTNFPNLILGEFKGILEK
jgi:hypothetical protein